MSIMPYNERPAAPLSLDPAIAYLGNEPEGMAVDFCAMRMFVRDRTTGANNFLGDPNSKLTYTSPSAKLITNGFGVLVSGTAMRCDHDPATLDTSTSTLHSLHANKSVVTTGAVTYVAGQDVRLTDAGNINNWMLGRVVSWTAGTNTLVLAVYASSGYFSASSWAVIVALGILVEEQRTRTNLYPTQISSWAKSASATVTPNAALAPDGTMTASRIAGDGTGGVVVSTPNVMWTTIRTRSVYVKMGTYRYARLSRTTSSNAARSLKIDLLTGQLTPNGTNPPVAYGSQYAGNGWWRIWTRNDEETTALANPRIVVFATSFIGDQDVGWGNEGNYPAAGEDIYVWGAQMEDGMFPTSLILGSETAQVTRAADSITLAASQFPLNSNSHAMLAQARSFQPDLDQIRAQATAVPVLGLSLGSSTSGQIFIARGDETTRVYRALAYIRDDAGTATVLEGANNSFPVNVFSSFGLRRGGSSFDLFGNGALIISGTNAGTIAPNQLNLGKNINTSRLNGHLKRAKYLSRTPSDVEMQAMAA